MIGKNRDVGLNGPVVGQWLDLDRCSQPSPYYEDISGGGVWTTLANMTSSTHTIVEPSRFWIQAQANVICIKDLGAWTYWHMKIQYSLDGAAFADYSGNLWSVGKFSAQSSDDAREFDNLTWMWMPSHSGSTPPYTLAWRMQVMVALVGGTAYRIRHAIFNVSVAKT